MRDVERLTSIPGTVLLILLTVATAAFIFEPARGAWRRCAARPCASAPAT
jgi:hypothetical protein